MNTDNNELSDFVRETLRQIQEGTIGHTNIGEVDFEVAIAKTISANGKIGVVVLGTGVEGELKTENTSKIKFSTRLKGAYLRPRDMNWPK